MKLKQLFKKITLIIILTTLSISSYLIMLGYQSYADASSKDVIQSTIETIQNDPNYITIDQLPETYINAVLAAEDHRFYQHNGLDYIAITRAIYHDIKALSFVEGGSTITQQIAKNLFFTQEKTFTRKIAEVFSVFHLENNYSKDELFEVYVNCIYFGDGYYGIYEASMGYFDKTPNQLNDYEATLLAGIPNAPSIYALSNRPDLAEQRQNTIISLMIKHNYLNQEEANQILLYQQ